MARQARLALAVAAGALAAIAGAARAQQAPPTPGTVLQTIEPHRAPSYEAPAEILFRRGEQEAVGARGATRFQVRGFNFVGNTVFPQGTLRRIVERWLDLPLNLSDLERAADSVTRYYRDHGYPVARAVIPTQHVVDGLVTVEVIEGRIGKIDFDGERRYNEALLKGRTAALAAESPVTLETLERSILLLNDLPGVRAQVTLQPGEQFGSTDAVVKIEEKPAELQLQIDNSGREETGRMQLDANGALNNPLGLGDRLSLHMVRSQDGLLRSANVGYSIPLGASGLRAAVAHTSVDYRVAGAFQALGISGEVRITEATLTYPYVRSRLHNVSLSGGLRRTETHQSALGASVSDGDLKVLALAASGNWVYSDSSVATALAAFSGNFRSSATPDPNALRGKYQLEGTYLSGISPHWDAYLHGSLVHGVGRLPDTEKFSLGGPDSVRAYQAAELRGDDGYLLSAEFRRQFALARTVGVFTLFYDRGAVHNAGFAGLDTLHGYGAGVALFPTSHSRVQLELAIPQGRTPSDGKSNGRAWVSAVIAF